MAMVIKILDEEKLVINVGEEDGIEVGDTVSILEKFDEIVGANGMVIRIPIIKQDVKVVEMYDDFSICSTTPKKYKRNSTTGVDFVLNTLKFYDGYDDNEEPVKLQGVEKKEKYNMSSSAPIKEEDLVLINGMEFE